jgi:glutamate racemase
MEPAVKPATRRTRSGVVGVIATPATFQGELFASLLERFAGDADVLSQICPGLVQAVEAGALDDPATEALVRQCLSPLVTAGIDQLVLGCTHYPFLRPVIERVVGPDVAVIDPAPAVARQVARVLADREMAAAPSACESCEASRPGRHAFYTSGDVASFVAQIGCLLPSIAQAACVRAARWNGVRLEAAL